MLLDEPAAQEVLSHLALGGAAITSVNAAEVLDRLCRGGASPDEAEADLAGLGAEVVHPGQAVVLRAGLLRGRHYKRDECPVSLADCVGAAHALDLGVPLGTSDGPLAYVVRSEGGQVIALPDSAGRRP